MRQKLPGNPLFLYFILSVTVHSLSWLLLTLFYLFTYLLALHLPHFLLLTFSPLSLGRKVCKHPVIHHCLLTYYHWWSMLLSETTLSLLRAGPHSLSLTQTSIQPILSPSPAWSISVFLTLLSRLHRNTLLFSPSTKENNKNKSGLQTLNQLPPHSFVSTHNQFCKEFLYFYFQFLWRLFLLLKQKNAHILSV